MVAAGLLTGEAFFGTESSILSFIDSLWIATPDNETGTFFGIDEFSSSVQWYIGRMVGFIGLNLAIGGGESVDAVLEN
jgi:hypothetical protein